MLMRLRGKPAMTVNGWSITFLATTIALLLTSCEKEIEFKGEQTDPKLVVNCLAEAGQPVKAYISKSYFFLDTDENTQVPDDVVATLYVNDNLIGAMTPHTDTIWHSWYDYDEEGNPYHSYRLATVFSNEYCPQEGDVVRITASANGYDDVEGTSSALPKPIDCQMSVEVTRWYGGYTQHYNHQTGQYEEDSVYSISGYMDLTFTISDPNPGQTDYFRFHLNGDNGISIGDNRWSVYFDYDDPIFGTSLENDFVDFSDLDLRPEGVFTDVLFDGKEYQIKIKDLHFNMDLAADYNPDFYRVPFNVEHLTKEYYNYLNTCNQGEVGFQIWAEPIQTFSNVKGGYGIVAGHTVETLWLDLPLEE